MARSEMGVGCAISLRIDTPEMRAEMENEMRRELERAGCTEINEAQWNWHFQEGFEDDEGWHDGEWVMAGAMTGYR